MGAGSIARPIGEAGPLSQTLRHSRGRTRLQSRAPSRPGSEDLLDAVREARQECLQALGYFNSVAEPELVERAVHLLCAAEQRYLYVARVARLHGVRPVPELEIPLH